MRNQHSYTVPYFCQFPHLLLLCRLIDMRDGPIFICISHWPRASIGAVRVSSVVGQALSSPQSSACSHLLASLFPTAPNWPWFGYWVSPSYKENSSLYSASEEVHSNAASMIFFRRCCFCTGAAIIISSNGKQPGKCGNALLKLPSSIHLPQPPT